MRSPKVSKHRTGKRLPARKVPSRKAPATKRVPAAKSSAKKETAKKPVGIARTHRARRVSLQREIDRLIRGRDRRMHLLHLEKARRGIAPDDLLFIGMHNIAQSTWCPMQAVLKSRQNELEFFGAYLEDRVRHAVEAKLITRAPKDDHELLAIGNDLTLKMVEDLDRRREAEDERDHRALGYTVELVLPEPAADDYKAQGSFLEHRHAEEYPTTRWNFEWGRYVVVGVPDGLVPDFVYEFKTTGKRHFLPESQAGAFAQADLYGYFFGRQIKRVQILVREDGGIETWQASVDHANAKRLLRLLDSIQREGVKPDPPPSWKCRPCEFKEGCPLLEMPGGWRRVV